MYTVETCRGTESHARHLAPTLRTQPGMSTGLLVQPQLWPHHRQTRPKDPRRECPQLNGCPALRSKKRRKMDMTSFPEGNMGLYRSVTQDQAVWLPSKTDYLEGARLGLANPDKLGSALCSPPRLSAPEPVSLPACKAQASQAA